MTLPLVHKIKKMPLRRHWFFFAALCVIAYAFFAHPDVVETSNHSYVLLDSLFKGRFLQFYSDVMAHPFGKNLYYTNNAHYNIVMYVIFALAELPMYLFNLVFGLPYSEPLLYFIGKLVSAGFFIACIPVVRAIALELSFSKQDADWAALFFALSPPVFFSTMIMGQYDSICLLFILLGILNWLRGKTFAFALWMGAGAACKFFSLLLFIPLVLLAEKRPLHILKQGLLSLWLVLPTTLLFAGRTGDMGIFNQLMMNRLFSAKMPAASDIPIFPLLYFLLCIVAYFWKPKEKETKKCGIWVCVAVFATLFLFVDWHPQWVILMIPFLVLTTFMEKNRMPWFWVDIALAAGYFLFCAIVHPYQLEANMLDYGILGLVFNMKTTDIASGYNSISFYLFVLPIVAALPMVLFGGAALAHTALKIPYKGTTLATQLAKDTATPAKLLPVFAWLIFGLGGSVWLFPTLFTWLKCFSFI